MHSHVNSHTLYIRQTEWVAQVRGSGVLQRDVVVVVRVQRATENAMKSTKNVRMTPTAQPQPSAFI